MFKTSIVLGLILCCFLPQYINSQVESQEEQKILDTLNRFKKGVEKGDLEVGRKIATSEHYPIFKNLYNPLADIYSRLESSFPMEVGHQKILKNGLAKVEVYLNPGKNFFVFTFKKDDGIWKICHHETIRFPLYSIPDLPYKDIYEIPEKTRKWMNAEIDLNFKTWTYFYLKKFLGKEKALSFFQERDGPGYKVAMDAWLPFLEGAAQFAFYFAIMDSNFHGSQCEIVHADYNKAEVFCPQLAALEVLKRGHAVPKFSYDEYTKLFTAIMKNRAENCGLDLEITFSESSCSIKIKRKQSSDS